MPLPTPFHPRTSALCTSLLWKDWAGCHAVRRYDTSAAPEYFATRQAAGLLDVSPLHKVAVRGPDAASFLGWVSARDVARLSDGQVGYTCWCDERGKVLDDGTVTRWADDVFRITSADPSWAWLRRQARGFAVELEDESEALAALALQGPRSRAILEAACDGGAVGALRFFRATETRLAGVPVQVTRTGYTGDLGYELWIPREGALPVWDALMEAGRPHGLSPLGLDALDVLRIEAGFVLLGVDYHGARRALVEAHKSTPFEIGLGWSVHLDEDRPPFVGEAALRREAATGPAVALVGLEADWEELEALFGAHGLPPELPADAWRTAVPVYDGHGHQVGRATSGAWSPLLKKNLALATVQAHHAAPGERLRLEVTVEYERRAVAARVVERPFFDPPRKRSTPGRGAGRAGKAATP